MVSKQLATYLKDNGSLTKLNSAFRAYHSTETAVLRWWATCTGYRQHRTTDDAGSFCSGFRSHTAFKELSLAGLLLTSPVEVSTSALQYRNPPCHLSCTACRKGWSSGRFCLSCMSLTYCSWWKITDWCLTHTWMIPRFLVFVVLQSPKHFRTACPTASTLLDRGWLLIGSFWTMTRHKHCGVHPYDGNIRSRRDMYVSEVHLYSQLPLSGILESTSILILQCALMWPQLSGRASLYYAR